MYCKGRVYVDGLAYRILQCHISIPGCFLNQQGVSYSTPPASKFHIELESRQETHLLRWITEGEIKDHVHLKFKSAELDERDKTFDLHDVICVRNEEYFWSKNTLPMTNSITLIPAILIAQGVLLRVQSWHIQNPKRLMGGSAVIATERPVEGILTDCYFEDQEGNVLTKVKKDQDIYAVVKSTNMTGKVISIDLSNDKVDYEYNGQYLENELLENINVTADIIKIPLKTLKQRN